MTNIAELFRRLFAHYGPQGWWPSSSGAFETMTGAVLVQRTSWNNAALAITRLAERRLLAPAPMHALQMAELADAIRPAGFYNLKAARLKNMARFVISAGGLSALRARSTVELRRSLLAVDGIGEETADAILLYAFDRPAVVVDAYYRRLVGRLKGGAVPRDADIRCSTEEFIADSPSLNELHALIVEHGKSHCASRPVCDGCCLREMCATGAPATPSLHVRARAWSEHP